MKDIDFDELDRAVNSLMASTEPEDTTVKTDHSPTTERILEVSSKPLPITPPAQSPVVAKDPEPPVNVSVARPTITQPTNRGRFMDMVHGSTDVKPRSVPPAPTVVAPSREGLTITPRDDTPTKANSDNVAVKVDTPKSTPFDTMPDPIDIAQPDSAPSPSVTPETPALKLTKTQPELTESPFLNDAKVEKRPLNPGFQVPVNLDLDDTPTESTDKTIDNKVDEPPLTPEVPELNRDLLAIESSEKLDDTDATQVVDTADAASQVAAPAPPLGSASIPQQYTSQPSTGDQSHAAIYDSSQYPEPVTHPAKKKSGWLWVLWVILLLGVGAGGAILLYNLGIIP